MTAAKHQPWCDRDEHARAAEELDEAIGCVGRRIQVRDGLAGWWHQDQPGGDARFHVQVDVNGGGSWEPSPRDLQVVEDALSAVGGTPDDLLDLILTAQADMEHGIGAGGER